ncbi:MAG: glutamine--fructose-6-phosphate transaminase (isomerizing) [Dehalococcoidia bacterium]|nr:glutamine--fructose-6-phosphate transaminase (isomerizing) [Dehalococcoidia bacterium]
MCGIVAYTGAQEAYPILLRGLKRVEYRGYDSCGVALPHSERVQVYKDLGAVDTLKGTPDGIQGNTGIAHTRWATVGEPSQANAHPHSDCTRRIAIVHNGDIDNFLDLKQELQDQGHSFSSQTDSEVIAHLIEREYDGDLKAAVTKATARLEGSYAIAVVAAGFPGVVVMRKDSPLVLGLGNGENLAASDAPALLERTKRVVYLEDGDLAVLRPESVELWRNGAQVELTVQEVAWNVTELDRAGYPHFMLKEIHEQPRVIRDTLAGRISLTDPRATLPIAAHKAPSRVIFIGCGTSYHAALTGQYFFSQVSPLPVNAYVASEFDPAPGTLRDTWVVALSQSGETADTINAIRKARTAGAWTVAVTNVMSSSITRATDDVFYMQAGPEVSVAATKTFMAQLVAVYLLAMHLAPRSTALAELVGELRAMPSKVQRLINAESQIKALAAKLTRYDHMFLIARGINVPMALEGALKLKEVAYLHAEGFAAGELKHGPFALLGLNTPVIAMAPHDGQYPRMLTAIKEIKARGAPVTAIAFQDDTELERFVDDVLHIPVAHPLFAPWLNTVALQLLSYSIAELRGLPIDKPRHLAKSVTVF